MQMYTIKLRYKELNARGNGAVVHRRLRLPDGTRGWASDLAEDVTGSWSNGTFLASDRNACQRGKVPVGTIILDFESPYHGGGKSGRAEMRVGIITEEANEQGSHLHWGLSVRKRGNSYEVKTTNGEWVEV